MNKTILKNILIFVVIFGLLAPLPLTNFSPSVQAQTNGKIFSAKVKQYQAIQRKSDLRKQHFAQINADLKKIQQSKNTKETKNFLSRLEKDFKVVQQDLTQIRQELVKNRASYKILKRLADFQSSYQKSVQGIVSDLRAGKIKQAKAKIAKFVKEPEFVKDIQNPHPFRAKEFDGKIKTAPLSAFKAKENNANLTPDSIKLKKQDTRQSPNNFLSSSLQNVVQSTAIKVTAIDPIYTQETEEIQFSQSIKNLAAELNYDPLTIFNYVKNNIDYTPYYGSKKGANATLLERTGNDFDQASLLSALLRAGDTAGGHKIPTRYKQANIKIDLAAIMDLLGVEDPLAAAGVLSKTGAPYILYTDAEQNPLFFVIEHFYIEAYIDYDYTRGLNQTETEANKQWVPLDPSLSRYYYSQNLNIIEQMSQDLGFKTEDFYEQYLNGDYAQQKPMAAFKQKIEAYLAQYHPDLTYEDILTQEYKQEQNFEFLPSTLPYEIIEQISEFAAAPNELKHKLKFTVQNQEKTQNQLVYQANLVGLSNKELVLAYQAASPEDQAIIDSFPSIYDVVPLALVQLKPVVKVQGQVKAGGGAQNPSVQMGRTQNLKLEFIIPQKQITSPLTEKTVDTQEKYIIAGNAEGIAINTDKIVLPEIRPQEDTQTSEFLPTQKLFRTALNYLDRLQRNHDELAGLIGAKFTNTATRAIVFNGIQVSYQNNEPYSFNWTGLRIDASALVSYYHRFSQDINKQQKEFMFLFGLEGSLDESSIFEEDFQIEAMSTVKGLRLINQGQIAGVQTKKITMTNISEIDALQISDNLKTKYRDLVRQGNTIYTPTKQYTYQNWTGLVYISINPNTGFGGYTIGEGLNGGYTACAVPTTGMQAKQAGMCYWPLPRTEWLKTGIYSKIEALIKFSKPVYTLGEKIYYYIRYLLYRPGDTEPSDIFDESEELDSKNIDIGKIPVDNPSYEAIVKEKDEAETEPAPNPLNIDESQLIPKCDGGATGNCYKGRVGYKIEMIVLHYTGGSSADGAISTFKKQGGKTSAHYIIDRNGQIYRVVKDEDTAWHAGIQDPDSCKEEIGPECRSAIIHPNQRSIGIEIVNWGWLTEEGGNYKTYLDSIYNPDMYGEPVYTGPWPPYDIPPYGPQRYWQPFTNKQYTSLYNLIQDLTTKHNVNQVLFEPSPILYEPTAENILHFNGLLGHSVITKKHDPGPVLDWQRILFGP